MGEKDMFGDFIFSSSENETGLFEQNVNSCNILNEDKSINALNKGSCVSSLNPVGDPMVSKKECFEEFHTTNRNMALEDVQEKSNVMLFQQRPVEHESMQTDSPNQEFGKKENEAEHIKKYCEEISPNCEMLIDNSEDKWAKSLEQYLMPMSASIRELKKKEENEEEENHSNLETHSKRKVPVDDSEDAQPKVTKENIMEVVACLGEYKKRGEGAEDLYTRQIISDDMSPVEQILAQEENELKERDEGDRPDCEFFSILKQIMGMKQSEREQLTEEDKGKLALSLEEEMEKMDAVEEVLVETCEEIQTKINQVYEFKYKILGRITKDLSKHPEGEFTLDTITTMINENCETLDTYISEHKKIGENVIPVLPEPPNKFTMMSYYELNEETRKLKRENEEITQKLKTLDEEWKAEYRKNKITYKEIREETVLLTDYLDEMRQEMVRLERVLQESPNEFDFDSELGVVTEEKYDEDSDCELFEFEDKSKDVSDD